MASQQILFAETIAGMKKAFKRKAYESDSDSEIESYSNRGHKLKRQARFARQGQLIPTSGPGAYKESVDYAGVRRSIIHRNPPLIDNDGYEIDSDDNEARVAEAMLSAAELNPYANVRLENLLAPLTASTDLPTHPILSKPFTSHTLTELVEQSCGIMHKENQSLWQVRHLWTLLCGDATWVPCEAMLGTNDIDFYTEDHVARLLQNMSKTEGSNASSGAVVNGQSHPEIPQAQSSTAEESNTLARTESRSLANGDVIMTDPNSLEKKTGSKKEKDGNHKESENNKHIKTEKRNGEEDINMTNGEVGKKSGKNDKPKQKNGKGQATPTQDVQMQNGSAMEIEIPIIQEHGPEPTPGHPAEYVVHPMFLPPESASLDRNLGLPENEADDIRRLLALYVQKQEEVCRGAARLHLGLLKAERLRKNVLQWAKAEAHCGANRDMSDGEDWYDKEEWGLTEDLKKGQDEEEEDTATTGKKTRNRRQN